MPNSTFHWLPTFPIGTLCPPAVLIEPAGGDAGILLQVASAGVVAATTRFVYHRHEGEKDSSASSGPVQVGSGGGCTLRQDGHASGAGQRLLPGGKRKSRAPLRLREGGRVLLRFPAALASALSFASPLVSRGIGPDPHAGYLGGASCHTAFPPARRSTSLRWHHVASSPSLGLWSYLTPVCCKASLSASAQISRPL